MMDSISLRGDICSLPGMIPLHHAFGVKGPCQHQVIGLVNDAAAVVHRGGFDDFGFAFGVAFNLDTNWAQDVFGGSRCEPGAGACSASQQLLLEYMFPALGPEVSSRCPPAEVLPKGGRTCSLGSASAPMLALHVAQPMRNDAAAS